jgi:hypothetical protein
MLAQWRDVECACIPAKDLAALAELRALPGLRVLFRDDQAWVYWEGNADPIIAKLLPIPGVVFYCWREGQWYRLGASLPAFEVPTEGDTKPLHQVLFPAPVQPLPLTSRPSGQPIRLALAPGDQPHPATALLVGADELLTWADGFPTSRLAQLQAVCRGKEVLVRGQRLPAVLTGQRFWGETLLLPLGMRLEPMVPEAMVRAALNLKDGEVVLVREEGLDIIPSEAWQPLHRAGLRLLVQEGQR